MTTAPGLGEILGSIPPGSGRMYYHNLHSLSEFLAFLRTLPTFLKGRPLISVMVLESVWFLFQETSSYSRGTRGKLLVKVQQDVARLCADFKLTIITTSQLATKLVHPDGTPADFNTGSKAILVPQLGTAYLPPSRSYRAIIIPHSRTHGIIRLLSSPTHLTGSEHREELYEIVNGVMREPSN